MSSSEHLGTVRLPRSRRWGLRVAKGRRAMSEQRPQKTPRCFSRGARTPHLHPNKTAFLDFTRFLRGVEKVTGRKVGVVKVVILSQW